MGTAIPEADQGAHPLQSHVIRELATVLVVDDSAAARRAVGELLASHCDVKVAYARDGREALAAIADRGPVRHPDRYGDARYGRS